ncbi:MAG: DUF5793 family protein [Halobacteriaceae archaeon]
MRREQFELEVSNIEWVDTDSEPAKPTVAIRFTTEEDDDLQHRLTTADGSLLDASETDIAYRLLSDLETDDPRGVVSITNRITGDFILELNAEADDVFQFIRAARRYGEHTEEDGEFRVQIYADGEKLVTHDKSTFLVYNSEGELLRKHSLIPGGVEL